MAIKIPLSLLKEIRANLRKPNHTGEVENTGKPDSLDENDWRSVSLDRNKCACRLHALHRRVRALAKGTKS